MNEECLQEIQGIRETQRDLRTRMWALDGRIDNIGKELGKAVARASARAISEKPAPSSPEVVTIPFPAETSPVSDKSEATEPQPLPHTKAEVMAPASTESILNKTKDTSTHSKPYRDDIPANTETSQDGPGAPLDEAPKIPCPQTSVSTDEKEKGGFEMEVGRVWLVRLGILILLTGLVFLGNYAWTELIGRLGPLGKLTMIYLAGGTLAGLGWWVKRKREELSAYGKVLIGGGIATAYYATYAAHFVDPLRVIASPLIVGVALMAVAGGIIWLANRMRSETVAVVTVLLGFYTAAINPIAGFSLFSNLVLSVIAIVLLLRRQWLSVSFLSMIGCYAAFAFWSHQQTGSLMILSATSPSTFWPALLFPACYWLTFTVATFIARSETFPEGVRPIFLTLNNGGFFGLAAPLIATTYPQQFWIFAFAYSAMLLGLAWLAARKDASESTFDGAYLTQGLGLFSLSLLFKLGGYQLAIILALQSVTLLKLSRHRHGVILQIFSGLSAIGATGAALLAITTHSEYTTLTGAAVAAILMGAGWLFKQQRGLHKAPSFQYRAAGYVVLGLIVTMATVLNGAPGSEALYWLAGLAALFTASVYLLCMPELVAAGQILAIAVIGQWLFAAGEKDLSLQPLLTTVALLGTLMHWWPRQCVLPLDKPTKIYPEALAGVGIVGVLLMWTTLNYAGTDRVWALMIGTLVLLGYSFLTRAWVLAAGSQLFAIFAGSALVLAIGEREPWPIVTGALALFASQALIIKLLIRRVPQEAIEYIQPYRELQKIASVLIGMGIVECYVSPEWVFLAFSGLAFGWFLVGVRREPGKMLVYATLAALMAAFHFATRNFLGEAIMPSDIIGLGLLLVAQQIGKRSAPCAEAFTPHIQGLLIILGLLGAWLVTGRWVATVQSGFLLTVAWSVFALLVFGAGVALRECLYRWIALGVLALAIGRLFLFDVWQLDTIFRILSFLVLGAVLLALGFLYNRLAGLIRKWM